MIKQLVTLTTEILSKREEDISDSDDSKDDVFLFILIKFDITSIK